MGEWKKGTGKKGGLEKKGDWKKGTGKKGGLEKGDWLIFP